MLINLMIRTDAGNDWVESASQITKKFKEGVGATRRSDVIERRRSTDSW
jgi:hypothetical protein